MIVVTLGMEIISFSYFEEKLNKATNKKNYIEWVLKNLENVLELYRLGQ